MASGFTITMWGVISSDGSIESSGGGFTCKRSSTGTYVITFNTAYSSLPSVVTQQIHDGNLKDGSMTASLSTGACTIITGNKDGSRDSRRFSILITGN